MAKYEQIGRTATVVITNMLTNEVLTVKELRVTFKITKMKSKKKKGNKGNIQIYNLAPNSRKLIETVRDKKGNPQTLVELRVGYGKKTEGIIFRGTCEATSKFKSPEWVTTLVGVDGGIRYLYPFEKTYSKGTLISDIVKDIAETSGVAKFRLDPIKATLPRTRTFSGPPLSIINDLQKVHGFTFDVQDEGTIIRSNRYKLDTRYETKLSYKTGLLGEPRTKGDLVIVDALINHNIKPNSFITLDSLTQSSLNGSYSVIGVDTVGDTYSGAWTMTADLMSTKTPNTISTKEE